MKRKRLTIISAFLLIASCLFGQECIDLGLSVKWAEANIGASVPQEQGSLFAWGATESVPYYDWAMYPLCKGHFNELTKYNTDPSLCTVDGKTVLESEDDAASCIMGEGWRIPTMNEWKELASECEWTFTQTGCTVRSRKPGYEGKSIFLPYVASKSGGEIHSSRLGYYWTANLDTRSSWSAIGVSFYDGRTEFPVFGRFLGCSIRAVKK